MIRRHLLIGIVPPGRGRAGRVRVARNRPGHGEVGLILPMTGPSPSTGKQAEAAAKLFLQMNGNKVAGKKVELIVKDDTGAADVTKRLAQELVVNDKVSVLLGFGLTPLALAVAPIATQAKVPQIVTAAATAIITEQSPYIVRTSFTLPQATVPMAEWAAKNGIKKVATLVTDYGPGIDAEKAFKDKFTSRRRRGVAELRMPLRNPDFAPFLQRVKDAGRTRVFVFVPAGFGSIFMKQYRRARAGRGGHQAHRHRRRDRRRPAARHGRRGAGRRQHAPLLRLASTRPRTRPSWKPSRRPTMSRPNFMAVGAYDGMQLLYKALEKTKGSTDGEALIAAMKGMSWMSVRGPVTIDPETRDIIQNIYVRKVEKVNGELYNQEFAVVEQVKDPVKAAKK